MTERARMSEGVALAAFSSSFALAELTNEAPNRSRGSLGNSGTRRLAAPKENKGNPRVSQMDGYDQHVGSNSSYSTIKSAESNGYQQVTSAPAYKGYYGS